MRFISSKSLGVYQLTDIFHLGFELSYHLCEKTKNPKPRVDNHWSKPILVIIKYVNVHACGSIMTSGDEKVSIRTDAFRTRFSHNGFPLFLKRKICHVVI